MPIQQPRIPADRIHSAAGRAFNGLCSTSVLLRSALPRVLQRKSYHIFGCLSQTDTVENEKVIRRRRTTMPAERTLSRPSEQRRSNKPIMEKRRRARINHCLNELKALILEALRKDPARHSKLEKADILEMTVKHLQNIQRQQMALAVATDPTVMSKFRAGFNECAGEVSRYVSRIEGVEPGVRQRLLGHLTNCLTGLNSMAPLAFAGVAAAASGTQGGGPVSHMGMPHSLNVVPQLPFPVGDLNNNTAAAAAAAARMLGGLPLIPSRLPSGEIAFLLPSQAVPLFSPSSASTAAASAAPTATVTCNTDTKANASAFSTSRSHPPPPSTSPVSPVSTCTSGSSAFSPPIREEPVEVKPSLSPPPPPGFPRQTYVSCPASTSSREDPTQPSPSAQEHDRMWRPW